MFRKEIDSRTAYGGVLVATVGQVSDSVPGKTGVKLHLAGYKTSSSSKMENAGLTLTLDDAEAIGYSLLYAVKLQRDKEAGTDDEL